MYERFSRGHDRMANAYGCYLGICHSLLGARGFLEAINRICWSGLLLWAWVVLVWGIRMAVLIIRKIRRGRRKKNSVTNWIPWCVAPFLLIILSFAVASNVPFKIAFRTSRSAMDQVAQHILSDGQYRNGMRLGTLPFSSVRIESGVVLFTFDKKEIPWGRRGLYFSPDGSVVTTGYIRSSQKVEDGWYIWHYGGW